MTVVQGDIDRILDRFKDQTREATSRGVLVVEENVQTIAVPLRAANIRVIVPRPGMTDDVIKSELLPGRIFVTKSAEDFIYDASSYDYGIVSLDKLESVDPTSDPAKNTTVTLISRALIEHKLWTKRHGFILVLAENGKHRYQDLVD